MKYNHSRKFAEVSVNERQQLFPRVVGRYAANKYRRRSCLSSLVGTLTLRQTSLEDDDTLSLEDHVWWVLDAAGSDVCTPSTTATCLGSMTVPSVADLMYSRETWRRRRRRSEDYTLDDPLLCQARPRRLVGFWHHASRAERRSDATAMHSTLSWNWSTAFNSPPGRKLRHDVGGKTIPLAGSDVTDGRTLASYSGVVDFGDEWRLDSRQRTGLGRRLMRSVSTHVVVVAAAIIIIIINCETSQRSSHVVNSKKLRSL